MVGATPEPLLPLHVVRRAASHWRVTLLRSQQLLTCSSRCIQGSGAGCDNFPRARFDGYLFLPSALKDEIEFELLLVAGVGQ